MIPLSITTTTLDPRSYVALEGVLSGLPLADRLVVADLVGRAGGVAAYTTAVGTYTGIENESGGVVAYLKPGSLTLTRRAGFVPEGAHESLKESGAWEVRLSHWEAGVGGVGGLRKRVVQTPVCPECFMHWGLAETEGTHECL